MKTRRAEWTILALTLIVLISASILVPRMVNAQRERESMACRENLAAIRNAIIAWAGDHFGKYPPKLEMLVPRHLIEIPECPRSGLAGYVNGYSTYDGDCENGDFVLVCTDESHNPTPGHFSVDSWCRWVHHPLAPDRVFSAKVDLWRKKFECSPDFVE